MWQKSAIECKGIAVTFHIYFWIKEVENTYKITPDVLLQEGDLILK